jgi:hypothetical protein
MACSALPKRNDLSKRLLRMAKSAWVSKCLTVAHLLFPVTTARFGSHIQF